MVAPKKEKTRPKHKGRARESGTSLWDKIGRISGFRQIQSGRDFLIAVKLQAQMLKPMRLSRGQTFDSSEDQRGVYAGYFIIVLRRLTPLRIPNLSILLLMMSTRTQGRLLIFQSNQQVRSFYLFLGDGHTYTVHPSLYASILPANCNCRANAMVEKVRWST